MSKTFSKTTFTDGTSLLLLGNVFEVWAKGIIRCRAMDCKIVKIELNK